MNKHKDINNWFWIAYPITAAVIILGCTTFLIKGGVLDLYQMWSKKTTAEEVMQKQQQLQAKFEILSSVDTIGLEEELGYLKEVVPDLRSVWNLINELQLAGNKNDSVLVNYQGAVGDIREATGPAKLAEGETGIRLSAKYAQADIKVIRNILTDLEKMIPLVGVKKLSLNTTGMEMVVEGAWLPPNESSSETEAVLPEFAISLENLKEQIRDYTNMATISGG